MATKVTILGMDKPKEKELKKIEFVWYVAETKWAKQTPDFKPSEFNYIELIALDFVDRLDIMFAHNGNRSSGCLYLGHFNDGIV